MDIGGALTGFSSTVSAFFDLSRTNRLRRAISANLQLYSSLIGQEELAGSRAELGGLIAQQISHLVEGGDGTTRRSYGWSSFAVGITFTTAAGFALVYWTWPLTKYWWGWIAVIIHGFFTLMFLYASISVLLSPSDKKKSHSAKSDNLGG